MSDTVSICSGGFYVLQGPKVPQGGYIYGKQALEALGDPDTILRLNRFTPTKTWRCDFADVLVPDQAYDKQMLIEQYPQLIQLAAAYRAAIDGRPRDVAGEEARPLA